MTCFQVSFSGRLHWKKTYHHHKTAVWSLRCCRLVPLRRCFHLMCFKCCRLRCVKLRCYCSLWTLVAFKQGNATFYEKHAGILWEKEVVQEVTDPSEWFCVVFHHYPVDSSLELFARYVFLHLSLRRVKYFFSCSQKRLVDINSRFSRERLPPELVGTWLSDLASVWVLMACSCENALGCATFKTWMCIFV